MGDHERLKSEYQGSDFKNILPLMHVCMYTYLLMPISFTVALERLHILQYMLNYDV